MKKKSHSKSKSVSKSKASSRKKAVKKVVKKTAKKSAPKNRKPAPKAKPKKVKAPVSKKAKSVVKKSPSKAASKSAPPKVVKPEVKKIQQPVAQPPARKEEVKQEQVKNPAPQNRPSVGRPMPVNRRPEPARAIIRDSKPEKETGKTRYSDSELEEFRDIINEKLTNARKELTTLQAQMTAANEHGTDDTASTFKILEDGSDSLAKEEAGQLASRQKKFIEQLENALVRIENKTYGVCRVTGKLIPKERLRAVPHTTQSIEAKLNQYRD